MADADIVRARGIHKHFGHLHVLKGVDLDVAERELVFVIGPSGSGKSTLLRCLNRLEEPSSGSIEVAGIDMLDPRTDINHARQHIGMVFQSFNLYPHMTALGNVTLALRKVAGKSRAEADALGHAALGNQDAAVIRAAARISLSDKVRPSVPTRSPARDDGPSTFDGLSAERVARLIEMVRGLAILCRHIASSARRPPVRNCARRLSRQTVRRSRSPYLQCGRPSG